MSLLVPEVQPPARPSVGEMANPQAPPPLGPGEEAVNLSARILYLRSYLLQRAIVGFMGLSLPTFLIVGDSLFVGNGLTVRNALSAYYYSGMRDFFVGSLAAVAVFLVAYKIFEKSLNNVLSVIAGLGALTVAFFPTNRPDDPDVALSPLQERLGEQTVAYVHYSAAAVFIVSLAIISFFFGLQEGRRTPQRIGRYARMSPGFWRWFHWVCSIAILAAVAFMVLSVGSRMVTEYSLLIGQVVAIMFFGLSWLAKGLELDALRGPKAARRRWRRGGGHDAPAAHPQSPQ